MFVAAGAKEKIAAKRKERFFDDYVKSLLREAKSLGITREELIEMLRQADEGGKEDE